MFSIDTVIRLGIILFSVVLHEVAHGVAAEQFGDDTARREGRITLNPLPHIDPFGSILLPLVLFLAQASHGVASPVVFGMAKPVPVDFGNLNRPRLGMAVVSFAGPLTNFAIAGILAVAIRFVPAGATSLIVQAIVTNVALGVLNMLPVPPLDGSKILASVLPGQLAAKFLKTEIYGFVILAVLFFTSFFSQLVYPALIFFFHLFGLPVSLLFN